MDTSSKRRTPHAPGAVPPPDEDGLDALRAAIAGLAERPVDEHADALDQVHRDIVAALDRLAGASTRRTDEGG